MKRYMAAIMAFAFSAAAQHPAEDLPAPVPPLSESEIASAIRVAAPEETAISPFRLTPEAAERIVLSSVEDVTDEQSEGKHVLVTLYRYRDDMTIRRLVDLDAESIVEEQQAQHQAPPLADVEVEFARSLALANEQLREQLLEHQSDLKVEALLMTTPDEEDPLFGHRVVSLLFRTSEGYLTDIGEVLVDLTAATVKAE